MASAEFYQLRLDQFQKEKVNLEKIIRQYSFGRVAVALLIIFLAYLGFNNSFYFYPIPLLVALFFFLVRKQLHLEANRKLLLQLIVLNKGEIKAVDYVFDQFPSGSQFISPHHPFSHDLDLFGNGSLFQYLNRCATQIGEEKLAEQLSQLNFDEATILERQNAIRELGPQIDFRQRTWATGKLIHDAEFNLPALLAWLQEPSLFYRKKFFHIVRWLLPAITCLSLVAILFNSAFQIVFFFMMILQLTIASWHGKAISRFQSSVTVHKSILANYSKLFQLLGKQTFSSVSMRHHQQLATEASAHVKEFSQLTEALDTRLNAIALLFGNGLFLYDFHAAIRLEKWRGKHAHTLPLWLQSLAEWDALLSFAGFHFNHPGYAFGKINETLSIKGTEIGHPLIPPSQCVTNNFDLGQTSILMLITGANMAGKSTFLRTIGINYILAKNGSPVCARTWSSPIAALRTGMRTSDSLQEHQSYFFAELNRLKSIIEELRCGKPMIILLDEILKGTNSTDKQAGSRELIKQLIGQSALVLLATHDVALADLEQQYPDKVVNACFEGKIENDQLTFDYKLHPGVAQRANATFLMRQMGIIPPAN